MEFQGKVAPISQNISESGMLCRTSRKVDEMTLLDIKFELPDSTSFSTDKIWVECRGVVVRCEKKDLGNGELPYEVAIFFDSISKKDKDLLATLVEK
jgi:hypothetical protein